MSLSSRKGIWELGVAIHKYNDEVNIPLKFSNATNSTTSVEL
jgi:hypothetical protein